MNEKKAIEILGLKKDFSEDELKKNYKELAKLYHPDNKNSGDEQKFIDIQEAYKFLHNQDDNKTNIDETTNSKSSICPVCNGNGWKREKVKTSRGYIARKVKCTFCNGEGKK